MSMVIQSSGHLPGTNVRPRLARIAAKTIVALAGVVSTVVMMLGGTAVPAHADSWVSGCNWTGISGYGRGACVRATTGTKNYQNHTQWVGWVEAYRSGLGSDQIVKVESWGDGFYFSAGGSYARWGAQRWVRSGTNVCGAVTYWDGARFIACIAISV